MPTRADSPARESSVRFHVAQMRKRRPADHAGDLVMVADICWQSIVFSRAVSCFGRYGAVDPSRFEIRHRVVRLERTP